MSRLFRLASFALFPLALTLLTAGCHKDPALVLADNNQAGTQDPASDPAAANMPPVPDNSGAPGYQQGPPPSSQASYDPGYGEQPEYAAPQPPPPPVPPVPPASGVVPVPLLIPVPPFPPAADSVPFMLATPVHFIIKGASPAAVTVLPAPIVKLV